MTTHQCPCGTGQRYEACCGLFLSSAAFPTTAEELMRSRYTAFVRMDKGYLACTWHPKTLPRVIHLSPNQVWLGLTVNATKDGGPLNDTGTVDFTARYVEDGIADKVEEKSEFIRVDGKWTYLDGIQA